MGLKSIISSGQIESSLGKIFALLLYQTKNKCLLIGKKKKKGQKLKMVQVFHNRNQILYLETLKN